MQQTAFDDRTGLESLRKRQLHSLLKSKHVSYPAGATKDRCIKIAVGAGISGADTVKGVSVSDKEIAEFDLGGKKRSELMAMGSKLGVKVEITMKKSEILALVEKALDE